jgi:hypothetical protein
LQDPILKKPFTQKRLVEWLKVQVLSSKPSTAKWKKSRIVSITRAPSCFPLAVVLPLSKSNAILSSSSFFFQDRVSRTICLGWLQTEIFLISAS